MYDILSQNEAAFMQRYRISLTEMSKAFGRDLSDSLKQRLLASKSEYEKKDINDDELRDTLFAMTVGFGDGSYIRHILMKLSDTAVVFVWEPDWCCFLYVCSKEDISDLISNERIEISIGRPESEEVDLEQGLNRQLGVQNMYHTTLIPMRGFYDLYGKEANDLIILFKKVIFEQSTDVATRILFKQGYMRNELLALSQASNNCCVNQLFDRIPTRDIPVIIVAAGPSLAKNAGELIKAEGRALIITVAHALKTIEKNGVKPSVVAVADGLEGQARFLNGDEEASYTVLMNVKGSEEIQKKYNGNMIYESLNTRLFPVSRFSNREYIYPNGGSVATNAFGLFLAAGFKTFILVGQDLAYAENGTSHADGGTEGSNSDQYVEGINGNSVKTRGDWVFFLQSYEKMIAAKPEATVIDATEGGALIHGTKIMSLSQAIDECCAEEYPVREWFSNLPKGNADEESEIQTIIKNHYQESCNAKAGLEEAVRLNRDILTYYKKGTLGESIHADECNRYDSLYRDILTEQRAELLREYCDDLLQLYIKEALSLERDSDLALKLEFEHTLFDKMRTRSIELLRYMEELFPAVVEE